MFKFKKTYTIEFEKEKYYDCSKMGIRLGRYGVIRTNVILKLLILFCSKNNIELKKFYVDDYSDKPGYIKIKGTKKDYQKLIVFLISGGFENYIRIKNLKA